MDAWRTILSILILVAGLATPAAGQCPRWLPGQGLPGVVGPLGDTWVLASVNWDPDGPGPQPSLLVIGGRFTSLDGQAVTSVAAWNGSAWQSFGEIAGTIFALTVYNGQLVAAGYFPQIGGSTFNSIAVWSSFGAWLPLESGGRTGVTFNLNDAATVYSLSVYNGQLIAAGTFSFAGGTAAAGIARWNGSAWDALAAGLTVEGFSGRGFTTALFGGNLIVGGDFTEAGGTSASRIARWDGSAWHPLGAGVAQASPSGNAAGPYALGVYGGELFVTGNFLLAGGAPARGIARWNGSGWASLGTGLGSANNSAGEGYCLAIYGGELFVGGRFELVDGVPARGVARWDGSGWSAAFTAPDTLRTLTPFDGELFGGGSYGMGRWNGSDWRPFAAGFDGTTAAFTSYGDQLIAGGRFTSAGGVPAHGVARWDGLAWSSLGAGLSNGGSPVDVMALASHGTDLIAAGVFQSAGGQPARNIARWDGSGWSPLGAGIGSAGSGWVAALAVYNGDLIAAGGFTTAGGVAASSIARWDGSAWRPLGGGITSASPYVEALTVYNNELYACGDFTVAGGVPASRIARWNGSAWQPVGSGTNFRTTAMCVYNNQLIVGGGFSSAGGVPASHVARWNGSSWSALGSGVNGWVYSLSAHNGQVIVGGLFQGAGGVGAGCIARWNGSSWSALGSGVTDPLGQGSQVEALGAYRGELIAGGRFQSVGGRAASHWARWTDTGTPWIAVQPVAALRPPPGSSAALRVVPAAGYAPVTYQWGRNGVALVNGTTPWGSMISGSTAASLLISGLAAGDSGQYHAVVSGSCGGAASAAASLMVCAGNCDGSITPPVLNVLDFVCFQNLYARGDPAANCDGSTVPPTLNVNDFTCFVNAYAAGCP